jgi:hypothetical protein
MEREPCGTNDCKIRINKICKFSERAWSVIFDVNSFSGISNGNTAFNKGAFSRKQKKKIQSKNHINTQTSKDIGAHTERVKLSALSCDSH